MSIYADTAELKKLFEQVPPSNEEDTVRRGAFKTALKHQPINPKKLEEQGVMPYAGDENLISMTGRSSVPLRHLPVKPKKDDEVDEANDKPIFKAASKAQLKKRGQQVATIRPVCDECGLSDKVVKASYDLGDTTKDYYWECERCNTVVQRISTFPLDEAKPIFKAATPAQLANRPKNTETLIEELIPHILDEMQNDSENESLRLYNFYIDSFEAKKKIIDDTLIYLCGWSLDTLIKDTLGTEG